MRLLHPRKPETRHRKPRRNHPRPPPPERPDSLTGNPDLFLNPAAAFIRYGARIDKETIKQIEAVSDDCAITSHTTPGGWGYYITLIIKKKNTVSTVYMKTTSGRLIIFKCWIGQKSILDGPCQPAPNIWDHLDAPGWANLPIPILNHLDTLAPNQEARKVIFSHLMTS